MNNEEKQGSITESILNSLNNRNKIFPFLDFVECEISPRQAGEILERIYEQYKGEDRPEILVDYFDFLVLRNRYFSKDKNNLRWASAEFKKIEEVRLTLGGAMKRITIKTKLEKYTS